MSHEAQEPWIEIDDPEVNSAMLQARVEQRLQQRRAALGPVTRSFPAFQAGTRQGDAGAMGHEPLQTLLDQIAQASPPIEPELAPSPVTRLPIVGRLWGLLRSQTHELILFYVNRHLAHQTKINHATEQALRELSALLAQQENRIDTLGARLAELEQRDEQDDG